MKPVTQKIKCLLLFNVSILQIKVRLKLLGQSVLTFNVAAFV